MSQFLSKLSLFKLPDRYNGNPLYRVTAPLRYQSSILAELEWSDIFDGGIVTVPAGVITDLASIPSPVNKVLKPDGPWSRAAVIHDYLCKQFHGMSDVTFPNISRKIADSVLYEALIADGVNSILARSMWLYVRLFG